MKIKVVVLVSMLTSLSAYANPNPCQTQAREVVYSRLGADAEYCKVKLKKASLSRDVVSFKASISCVSEGGFFDMTDFVVMKYQKKATGNYQCTLQ